MSRWQDSFQSQQPLPRVRAALAALQATKTDSLTSANREDYERAIKALKFLEARLTALDPELFNQNAWANFGLWLSNAQAQAENFSRTLNQAHLQNLNAHLDELLNALKPIDIKFSVDELRALTEAGAIYRQKIIEELELVKKRADEVQKQYDSLSGEIKQGKVRLDENDKLIASQKTRLDTSIAEYQKQFSTAQETRNQEFQKAIAQNLDSFHQQLKGVAETFQKLSEMQTTEFGELVTKTAKRSDEYLEYLNKRKKEVDDIYGAIGSAALAGNFNDTANRERTFANRWRAIAFSFFIAMGIVAIVAFALTFETNPDWHTFIFRLGTVIVLSLPAFYAANESSKHRMREKIVRKNFLELSAIDAYIVHLPATKQVEVKEKLAEKFFGVPEPTMKAEPVSTKALLGFVERLVKDLTAGH